MNNITQALSKLSTAEEFLDYFSVQYEQKVVNINRLHILKRFNQYLAQHVVTGKTDQELRDEYRQLLERAYLDFVASDAVTEKVFKVFQDAVGVKTFSIDNLRESMRTRNAEARNA